MKYRIALSDISYDKSELLAVSAVLKSGWLSQGKLTEEFERVFSRLLGVKYSLAVCNCTAALHLALLASGIGKGDEVIVPSLTFVATVNSIVYSGATPVFTDIESLDNPTISVNDIKSKITKKTKTIMVVHFGGYPSAMSEIQKLCKKYKLKLIEDSAHAINVKYKKGKLGGIGDVGCFSFFANKNITTGEGGMLTTNDKNVYEQAKLLRAHSMTTSSYERHKTGFAEYEVKDIGFNYRITEIASALGMAQLKKLTKINAKRKKLVQIYKDNLKNVKEITIPFLKFRGDAGHHIFPILVNKQEDRLKLIEFLNKNGIQVSHHYKPVHLFGYYKKNFGMRKGDLPLTEEFSLKEITLPLHQNLTSSDVEYVCEKVKKGLMRR